MAFLRFGLRKASPSHAEPKPSKTPVSSSKWARLKSRLSGHKDKEVKETTTLSNPRSSTNIALNQPNLQETISPLRSPSDLNVTSALPTSTHLSLTVQTLRSRTANSRMPGPSSPGTRVAPSLSEYNDVILAPSGANMLGAAGLTEYEAPPSSTEESIRACYEARFSEYPARVSSSNRTAPPKVAARFVEGKERSQIREFERASALELLASSAPSGVDEISACLSRGRAAQARRSHLQHTRAPQAPAQQLLAPKRFPTSNVPVSSEKKGRTLNTTENASDLSEAGSSSITSPVRVRAPVLWHPKPIRIANSIPILELASKDLHESIAISSSPRRGGECYKPLKGDFKSERRRIGPQQPNQVSPAGWPLPPAKANKLGAVASSETKRAVDTNDGRAQGETGSSPSVALIRSDTVLNYSRPRPQGNQISIKVAPGSVRTNVNKVNVTDHGDNIRRAIDTNNHLSAGGKAGPSPSAAPTTTASSYQNCRQRSRDYQIVDKSAQWSSYAAFNKASAASSVKPGVDNCNKSARGNEISTKVVPTSARPTARNASVTDPCDSIRRDVDTRKEKSAGGEAGPSPSAAPRKTVSNYAGSRQQSRDHSTAATFARSAAHTTSHKANVTGSVDSNRRAIDGMENASAKGEAGPSPCAAPINPNHPSHPKPSESLRHGGDFAGPSVRLPKPQNPSSFTSWSTSRKDGQESKSSTTRCDAATGVSVRNGRSSPGYGPYPISQTSARVADASGSASTGQPQTRCPLHTKGSPGEPGALQANAQSDKIEEWLNCPVPTPKLNLGNDGRASETTVFTSKGPMLVSHVEELLRWWSQCNCSDRYTDWRWFALLAGYSIGDDNFTLTPLKQPPPRKTGIKAKFINYFRKS